MQTLFKFLVTILMGQFIQLAAADVSPSISRFNQPKYEKDFKALDYVNAKAPKGGRIRIGTIGTFETLNKDVAKGTNVAEGVPLTFDPLMKKTQDDPHSWYGLIAEKADLAPDFSSITFYLNPKAKFHDGSAITAEDVEFSINLLKEKGLPRYKLYYSQIEKMEILNPHTIKFTFKKGKEGYDRELPMIIASLRVLSKKDLKNRDFLNTGLKPIVGSGAYKVAKVDQGRSIVLERVKDYWAAELPINVGQFNFDIIEIQYYKNNHSLFESFKTGEFDCYFEADEKQWNTAYNFKAIHQGKVKKVELEHTRPVTVRTLIFNMKKPLFSDIRLRKALAYAFDFETMNRQLFHNAYHRMTSLFANTHFDTKGVASDDVLKILEPYKNDLDPGVFEKGGELPKPAGHTTQRQNLMKADELLKQAGWVIKNDHERENKKNEKLQRLNEKTGDPLVVEFMVKDQRLEKVVLEYARSLQSLGITLKIRRVDSAQYERIVLERGFDMIAHSWTNSLSPGVEQSYYFSKAAADMEGSSNYIGIKNGAIETLAKKVSFAKSEQELEVGVQALDRAVMGMYYFVPAFYDNKICLAYWQERLDMPKIDPALGTNAMEWWWAK
ncbi:extracellular solute-binding protein [Candidatus Paracaedibacter symbiosus]|uniref:extracellular solute-binding protein n=1 Tax=Candidatus Paracaedibacter symbiosus TaxID=244582 RepID=UPI00068A70D1|nr:extracellular solute-binding protein [Candidatus Paracaedibacter symbiosus]